LKKRAMTRVLLMSLLIAEAIAFAACAESAHQTGQAGYERLVPADLRQQIDRSVTLPELKADPEKYEGRVVMLGGIVLSAKRRLDQTEIEVLELPLASGVVPVADRTRSEGRFLAVKKEFLDPATIRIGAPVTVIGQVKGTAVRSLDDTRYTYPVLEILKLTDWEQTRVPSGYYGWPSPYPYALYPYPYYSFYGRFWDPFYYDAYYYPYSFGVPGVRSAPPSPPPAHVPPQFKK
jgi:outer membrane lipoprotein